MSDWQTTERDGRPCRVRTRGSVEERVYTNSGSAAGWRYAAVLGTARVTSATASPPAIASGERAPAKPAPIRAQTGDSGIEIRLTREAISTIEQASYWNNLDDANRAETGGWLLGSYVGDAVHITGATSSDRERGPTSMKLNIDDLARIKLLRLAGTNFGICGAWHLHPRVGAWRASDADFAAWESMYEYINEVEGRWEPAIAAIVAVPEDDGSLAHPQLAAWTTTKQDGRLVTEPSRIVRAAG